MASTSLRLKVRPYVRLTDSREVLTAARDYYVSTSGSDSNSGLDSSNAFLTIQEAVTTAQGLDWNGYAVGVSVAAGAYNEDVSVFGPFVGDAAAGITFTGDITTPSNVTLNSTAACFFAVGGGVITVHGFKLVCPAGSALFALGGPSFIGYMHIDFGNCAAGYHCIAVSTGANVGWSENGTNYISGGAIAHMGAFGTGAAVGGSAVSTINITGTPNFSDAFVVCEGGGIDVENITFTGTGATGIRFHAEYNGTIVPTFGSSATYLPGDQPGYLDDTSAYNQFSGISSRDLGTVSSGTITALDLSNTALPSVRQWYYTNNGAHTLPAPTIDGYLRILVTNGASAGAITFSGFTVKAAPGDALNTTNTNKFLIEIFTINSISTYRVYALQ